MSIKMMCRNKDCAQTKAFVEDARSGDIVCRVCGRVVAEKQLAYELEEFRNFEDDEKDQRQYGPAESLLKPSTATSTGIGASATMPKALQNAQRRLGSTSADRSIADVTNMIESVGIRTEISIAIRKRAASLYQLFIEKKPATMRNITNINMVCTLLVVASRLESAPRSFDQLAQQCGTTVSDINTVYSKVMPILKDFIVEPTKKGHSTTIFIRELGPKLGLSVEKCTEAEDLAVSSSEFFEGKQPKTVAAVCLLQILNPSNLRNAAKDIGKAVSLTANTILLRHQELCRWLTTQKGDQAGAPSTSPIKMVKAKRTSPPKRAPVTAIPVLVPPPTAGGSFAAAPFQSSYATPYALPTMFPAVHASFPPTEAIPQVPQFYPTADFMNVDTSFNFGTFGFM